MYVIIVLNMLGIDITSVRGLGSNHIKNLIIETNFFRKIKQGIKHNQPEENKSSSPPKGGNLLSGLLKNKTVKVESFRISMPPGARVFALAGSGDKYLRSIFAYYKV
jgi:hypothetical protein